MEFINKKKWNTKYCVIYAIFSNFSACMFASTKDYIVGIICAPEKKQIIFYYWSWGPHLQHCKSGGLEKIKEADLGCFPISVLYITIFLKTNFLFILLLKCCIYMTHLFASIVKRCVLYRCIKETLWVSAIWVYHGLWFLSALCFVNHGCSSSLWGKVDHEILISLFLYLGTTCYIII